MRDSRFSLVAILIGLSVCLAAAAEAQTDPQTTMLVRDGWNALSRNETGAATEAFREALTRDPKNADLYLGSGLAAYSERRDDDAALALRRALQLDPQLTRARELLGLVLYRKGDLFEAIRTYELLDPNRGGNQEALVRLERWRREMELHNRMDRIAGSSFTVAFEGESDAALATRALESLERAAARIGQLLSFPLAPVAVVLYTGQQFQDITRSPTWAAGAYDGTIRIPIRGALENPRELDRVIAHEFTHAVVRSLAARGVPAWLNEGLATALEHEDTSSIQIQSRETTKWPPLTALKTSFGRLDGDQARLAYVVSGFAAKQLLDESGSVAVANLLRDLGKGVEFDTAFSHRIQKSFADFATSLSMEQP